MAGYTPRAARALGARYNRMAAAYRQQQRPSPPGQARAQVRKPVRAKVGGPSFRKPILMPEGTGIDWTPVYEPGQEQAPASSYDPDSAMAAALAARTRGQAQAEAAAKKKQAAIEYGEGPEGSANPFSQLAVLDRNYKKGLGDLEEGLNTANLFYSGYRGKALGEAANQYQQQKYEAGTRYRSLLADIDSALAAALLNADMMSGAAGGGGVPQNDRPGVWNPLGVPITQEWDPYLNSDAKYDVGWILANGGQSDGAGGYIDAAGNRYDGDGRRR